MPVDPTIDLIVRAGAAVGTISAAIIGGIALLRAWRKDRRETSNLLVAVEFNVDRDQNNGGVFLKVLVQNRNNSENEITGGGFGRPSLIAPRINPVLRFSSKPGQDFPLVLPQKGSMFLRYSVQELAIKLMEVGDSYITHVYITDMHSRTYAARLSQDLINLLRSGKPLIEIFDWARH